MEVPTKQDFEELRTELRKTKSELMTAIERVGQSKYITLHDCAEEWGVHPDTASRRLRKMAERGEVTDYNFDVRPPIVNRKEFYEAI